MKKAVNNNDMLNQAATILTSLTFESFRLSAISIREDGPRNNLVVLNLVHHARPVVDRIQLPVKDDQFGELHPAPPSGQRRLQLNLVSLVPLQLHLLPQRVVGEVAPLESARPQVALPLNRGLLVQIRYYSDAVPHSFRRDGGLG